MRLMHLGCLIVWLLAVAGVGGQPESPPQLQKQPNAPDAPNRRLLEFKTAQGKTVWLAAEHNPWADRVVEYRPGKPAPKTNAKPNRSLGRPNKASAGLGHGGMIVVEFVDNVLIDGPGDDLVIFEIGPKIEPTLVEISTDGAKWLSVGRVRGATSTLDIAPFVKPGERFRFVKLIDARAKRSNKSKTAGADIDAVGALHSYEILQKAIPDPATRRPAESLPKLEKAVPKEEKQRR
jgi:hypothetical protein